jgi:ABC-type hemin transport system substrate-binding protein
MTHFRQTAIALAVAMIAGAGAAHAQTTVIKREPVQTETVVTTQPVQLAPVQRETIYRMIVRDQVVQAPATIEYRIGARVPPTAHLYVMPHDVVATVPAVSAYRYMVVNNRVVLVDPATSEVVAELGE